MADTQYPEIQTLVDAWQPYHASVGNWQELVQDIDPKTTGCGPVYELDSPLDRPNESFAVADMRGVDFAQPHYHANGETEVYFVLAGVGRVVVGNDVRNVGAGDVVVTPSGVAHYAIPDKKQGLVLGVVNTPSFKLENNIDVTETNPDVSYDHELFKKLTQS